MWCVKYALYPSVNFVWHALFVAPNVRSVRLTSWRLVEKVTFETFEKKLLRFLVEATDFLSSTISWRGLGLRSGDCGQLVMVNPLCLPRWSLSVCCVVLLGGAETIKEHKRTKMGSNKDIWKVTELRPHRSSPASAGPFELHLVQPPVLKLSLSSSSSSFLHSKRLNVLSYCRMIGWLNICFNKVAGVSCPLR